MKAAGVGADGILYFCFDLRFPKETRVPFPFARQKGGGGGSPIYDLRSAELKQDDVFSLKPSNFPIYHPLASILQDRAFPPPFLFSQGGGENSVG